MRRHLRTVLILAATVLLLVLFVRQADLAAVGHEIRQADPAQIALALLATFGIYVFRAIRWQVMLAPVGTTHFWPAFRATVIGFAANALLPARAGEFLRPYVLARRERLGVTATFATIVLERLLDLLTVLLLFAAYVVFFAPEMTAAGASTYAAVKAGGAAAAGAVVGAVAVLFVLAGHPERLGRAVARAERILPRTLAHWLAGLARTFAEGLAVMRRVRPLAVALVLSLPVWLMIAVGVWFVCRAFDIDLPFTGTFLIIALLTVGVAVPTPGAVGGFHYAFRVGATTFFAVPNERAVGAAIVLHAVSFVPVALLGGLFMVQDGLTLTRVRALAGTEDAAEPGRAPDDATDGPEPGTRRARPVTPEGPSS